MKKIKTHTQFFQTTNVELNNANKNAHRYSMDILDAEFFEYEEEYENEEEESDPDDEEGALQLSVWQ